MDPLYSALYAASLASVVGFAVSIIYTSRKNRVSLSPSRVLKLTVDEAKRASSLDPVFLMHTSIALGVGLSIASALVGPFLPGLPLLQLVILAASVPLLVGLIAAFAWRVKRFSESKTVEKQVIRSTAQFSAASTVMQGVLMVAIALTSTELVLAWFPNWEPVGAGIGTVRNVLVAFYYGRPTVNLVHSFDRPAWSMKTPFILADVLSGKTAVEGLSVGVGKMSEFDAYERLSFDSCVEIGACESACPATAAGSPLSPRALVRKLSMLGAESGSDAMDPFGVIGEDELWSCTSCNACVSSCPVGVNHLDVVYDLRRTLTNSGKLDVEKSKLLENLSTKQNPYGSPQGLRAEWASRAGVKTVEENPGAEYLYWVGCVASFDQRAQKVATAMAKVLERAGVSFAILGREEACVGDPARRLGDEGRYQELAYQNIGKMNALGVKKVIASCPHCFNAIKNEYPQFGGSYEVVYHTQLISDLVRAGRVRVARDAVREISVTLHDACYASRYNSIFDEPRAALEATGAHLHEMHRNKEKTFCCGAGGSNYWYKAPHQKSVASIRTEEAMSTGAKTLATECPFCLSMFDDSTKTSAAHMEVKDVAEIVAENLA